MLQLSLKLIFIIKIKRWVFKNLNFEVILPIRKVKVIGNKAFRKFCNFLSNINIHFCRKCLQILGIKLTKESKQLAVFMQTLAIGKLYLILGFILFVHLKTVYSKRSTTKTFNLTF